MVSRTVEGGTPVTRAIAADFAPSAASPIITPRVADESSRFGLLVLVEISLSGARGIVLNGGFLGEGGRVASKFGGCSC